MDFSMKSLFPAKWNWQKKEGEEVGDSQEKNKKEERGRLRACMQPHQAEPSSPHSLVHMDQPNLLCSRPETDFHQLQ